MAPLPDNSTARLFVEYTSIGTEHTLLLRMEASAISTDAIALYNSFTAVAKAVMDTSDTFTGARFSAAGSNVSFPLSVSAVTGTATVPEDTDQIANFLGVSGRSVDGRRYTAKMFTPYVNPDSAGYRKGSPSGAELAFLNWFIANDEELATVSNSPVVFNNYLNYGYHAYWQRQARKA